MDARQQDPRAGAANGAAQAQAGAAPANAAAGARTKGIGWAELVSIALGLGGLYLLVKVRAEATPGAEDDLDDEHPSDAHHTHREDLPGWGHTFPHPENPPAWVRDEQVWERAKDRVRLHWHEYRAPWAVVAHVYEQMGGRTV